MAARVSYSVLCWGSVMGWGIEWGWLDCWGGDEGMGVRGLGDK